MNKNTKFQALAGVNDYSCKVSEGFMEGGGGGMWEPPYERDEFPQVSVRESPSRILSDIAEMCCVVVLRVLSSFDAS